MIRPFSSTALLAVLLAAPALAHADPRIQSVPVPGLPDFTMLVMTDDHTGFIGQNKNVEGALFCKKDGTSCVPVPLSMQTSPGIVTQTVENAVPALVSSSIIAPAIRGAKSTITNTNNNIVNSTGSIASATGGNAAGGSASAVGGSSTSSSTSTGGSATATAGGAPPVIGGPS